MVNQAELVTQAQANDANAFTTLYESIYKDLYKVAFYTLRV